MLAAVRSEYVANLIAPKGLPRNLTDDAALQADLGTCALKAC